MVYAEDLKSSAARLVGSSPTPGTIKRGWPYYNTRFPLFTKYKMCDLVLEDSNYFRSADVREREVTFGKFRRSCFRFWYSVHNSCQQAYSPDCFSEGP